MKKENRKSPHLSDPVSTCEIFLIKNFRTCILGYGYKRCEDIFSLQASSVTGNGNQLKWFEVLGISDILNRLTVTAMHRLSPLVAESRSQYPWLLCCLFTTP